MSNVKLNRVSQLAGEQKLIDGTKQFLWHLQSTGGGIPGLLRLLYSFARCQPPLRT
jgi:hypothetical protein